MGACLTRPKTPTKLTIPLPTAKRFRTFFDVEVEGEKLGRIEMSLFADIVPVTANNFLCLCRGVMVENNVIRYKGTSFHEIKFYTRLTSRSCCGVNIIFTISEKGIHSIERIKFVYQS